MTEQSNVSRRELRDPSVLRALSHPVRLALLEELATLRQATATELAERVGESPANCSWHLRQLAKYELIEEGTGGTGRQRPWRWINQSIGVAERSDTDEPEFTQARDALFDVLIGREVIAWRAWQANESRAPKPWSDASFGEVSLHWMTVEELAGLKTEIQAVVEHRIHAHLDRADPSCRPAGARPVRFVAWSIPSGRPDELPANDPPSPEEDR